MAKGDGIIRGYPKKIKRAWLTKAESRKRAMRLGLIRPKRKEK